MTDESDRLLIRQIRAGGAAGENAWTELVSRYEGRVRAFIRRRLKEDVVDDCVQETFIGFLNSLANYDDRLGLHSWLFTIAKFKVTDQLRRSGRRPDRGTGDDDAFAESRDSRQRAASSIARGRERLELEADALRRALTELLRGYRAKSEYVRIQTLELLFVKNWPNKRVAEFLAVSEQQVANHRFNAVKRLTEAMKAAGLPGDVFPELAAE